MKFIIVFIILNFSFFTLLYFKKVHEVKKKLLFDNLYGEWKRARKEREEYEVLVLDSWMSGGFNDQRYIRLLLIELGGL